MALVRQQGLYESYLEEVERLERERKPGAGYFGLKGGPADDPCHDRFAAALRGLYDELAAQGPDSGLVRQLMEYACTAPLAAREPRAAWWMLLAVQSLGTADAARREKFRAHKETLRAKVAAANEKIHA